jgi:Tol biopolymer transport system component
VRPRRGLGETAARRRAAPAERGGPRRRPGPGGPTGRRCRGWPTFSPDGTKLAFVGSGLHPLDTTLDMLGLEIYVRDLTTGVVDLVTVNATNSGSGDAWTLDRASFSPDGSRIAFTSPASNLVPGDTNQRADLFVRNLAARTTTLVSVNAAGTGSGNGDTEYGASFSPDGNLLAFTSTASDLVATDTNGASDVFVRNSPPERRASSRSTRPGPTAPGGRSPASTTRAARPSAPTAIRLRSRATPRTSGRPTPTPMPTCSSTRTSTCAT